MKDESQMFENFVDSFFNIRENHSIKIIIAHINISSLWNKFDIPTNKVIEYIVILCISETKNDDAFCKLCSTKNFMSIKIGQKFSWWQITGLFKK